VSNRAAVWYYFRVTGEFALIGRLRRLIGSGGPENPNLLLGIGDDAALWRFGNRIIAATTDTLVDGVHFRPDLAGWADIGWKALAVNLSDLAAVGAVPRFALVTLGLRPTTRAENVERLYAGMLELARRSGTVLAGGDIVRSPVLTITVTATGEIEVPAGGDWRSRVLLRSSARPGDLVAVTGPLGAAAAGLRLLLEDPAGAEARAPALVSAYRRPQPRLEVAPVLIGAGVRAAIDISDGLVADLGHICEESGVAAELEAGRVPVHPDAARLFGPGALTLALTGGEDYELAFTGPEATVAAVAARSPVPVTVIGRILDGEPGRVRVLGPGGEELRLERAGWDHLAGVDP
jgi:thiamine-monophosphate kinase